MKRWRNIMDAHTKAGMQGAFKEIYADKKPAKKKDKKEKTYYEEMIKKLKGR